MGDNVSGWGTDASNQVSYRASYQSWTPGQPWVVQFDKAKPESAVIEGTQNWSLTSYNHNICLDVASREIGYSFLVGGASGSDLSVILCGEGLG
jgi:hypothetical protein